MVARSRRATVNDLYNTEGKAELIGGRIVRYSPTGRRPNRIAMRILRNLDDYAESIGIGEVYSATMGFTVPILPSGRESFSPDTAYYNGPFPPNTMRFIEGPPTFAVEVRSENDYGDAAEREMEAKREDYFLAGTLVVWDVDPIAETVTCYRGGQAAPTIWRRGDTADAEPAMPTWRLPVDEIFR